MKEITKQGAQGDVMFRRVPSVPQGYELQKTEGEIVVAHSETGHHHTVSASNALLFTRPGDNMLSFLQMKGNDPLEVLHHRPYDTHEPMCLRGESGTVWEVRRQRESTPEGWRQVAD